MKAHLLPALLSAALIGLTAAASHAALILQPAGVSSTMDAFDTTAVGAIIDQSQLSLGYDSLLADFDTCLAGAPTHDSQPLSGHFSGDDNGANGVFDGGFIDFDLGGSCLVQRLVLWTDGSDLPAELRGFTLVAAGAVGLFQRRRRQDLAV